MSDMTGNHEIKPYLGRIKNWKIRNMVMMYLEARDKFKSASSSLKKANPFSDSTSVSFERMRDICDILFDIKEDHHLLYRRLIDPKKNEFEMTHKFMPDKTITEFMNNVGLLFHKVMVGRELKYLLEHYVEDDEVFQTNKESLGTLLKEIDDLFDHGIRILIELIEQNSDNLLLLTLLVENPKHTRKHFGEESTRLLIENFGEGKGLEEAYYTVGKYYIQCGRPDDARKMFKSALKNNTDHVPSRAALSDLS
jgi:tetratricopeptide (TPR) repeat protein